MKKATSLIPSALLIISALAVPTAASAQEACPANAEQQLYDMVKSVEGGEMRDLTAISSLADWGLATCPDRPDVLALSTSLYGLLMRLSSDVELVSGYAIKTQSAYQQYASSWTPKHKPTVVKAANGSDETYFGNKPAAYAMTNVLPYMLLAMAENGKVHNMISGASLQSCPYPASHDFYLENEIGTWDGYTKGKEEHAFFGYGAARIEALYEACPEHRFDLSYYRARHYGQAVDRLTDYWVQEGEPTMFGTTPSTYYLKPAGEYFYDEDKFNAAFEIYAGKARGFAAPLTAAIADYRAAAIAHRDANENESYKEESYQRDIRNMRSNEVDEWEDALGKLAVQ